AAAHVRLTNRVEQSSLTVIDVTHDSDHRRTSLENVIALFFKLALDIDVEAFEQLAVFVLRGHDLNLVAELLAENLERGLVERLRSGSHLTKMEQHRHKV